MLVVISNPTMVHDETSIVNQLFSEGLDVFHLRKPNYTASRTAKFLSKIELRYHSKIALHSNHEIANDFNIKRLHFPEFDRKLITENAFIELKNKGKILSSAIHTTEDYKLVSDHFEYVFLSPVFDSISKQNYHSILTPDFSLPFQRKAKIIALGGVDESKTDYAFALGFDGVAILGTIWENTEKSLTNFKRIQHKCLVKGQLY